MNFCKIHTIPSKVSYNPGFSWKLGMDEGFLSGERLLGLQKLMMRRGKRVTSGGGYSYKLLPEIGLNELTIKSIIKGKTAYGNAKMTITFTKSPMESWYRNAKESYVPIVCNHILGQKEGSNFKSLWYSPFTNKQFTEAQFKVIKKGAKCKCVVLHREETWLEHGEVVRYKQGRNIGKEIILIKPEIVSVYHIDTPDEDIEVNYFKLYKPLRK